MMSAREESIASSYLVMPASESDSTAAGDADKLFHTKWGLPSMVAIILVDTGPDPDAAAWCNHCAQRVWKYPSVLTGEKDSRQK